MPDDDLVLDDFRDLKLNIVERLRLRFETKSVEEIEEQARGKAKQLIFDGRTGAEMRRRNTGCGCTVVSYGHGRNNIAIQHGVTPVIAYRDAAEIIPTRTLST